MAKTELMGIGGLTAAFGDLQDGMKTRTGRAMVVSGGGVIKRRAKAIAQTKGLRRTGAMIKNIAIKRETQAPTDVVQYHIGVRHGRDLTKKQKATGALSVNGKGRIVKRYADDPYYWRFVELKTRRRAATPFLQPALEEGREEAIDAMAERLQREHDKVSKK